MSIGVVDVVEHTFLYENMLSNKTLNLWRVTSRIAHKGFFNQHLS